MVDVVSHNLFPTVVHQFTLDISLIDKRQMISYINQGTLKPNGMKQTEDDIHKISYFKNFKDEIITLNKTILDKLEYEYEDILITSMWGNLLFPNQTHSPHTHSNNFLSGVFYLQSDDLSGEIEFFDPRPQAGVLSPRIKKGIMENSNVIGFKPKDSMGLIFPAWLQHWVQPTSSERVSVSWNILVKGHYGAPNTFQNAYI